MGGISAGVGVIHRVDEVCIAELNMHGEYPPAWHISAHSGGKFNVSDEMKARVAAKLNFRMTAKANPLA
jgi:prolyl oligopeptidase PreP (S9A serine peptidase family)